MKNGLILLGLFLIYFAMSMPAVGQEPLAIDHFDESGGRARVDVSGHGAVLCSWWIYLSVQMFTDACKWPRQPADDAIDEAIVDIDKFIIANSPEHPTQAMLDEAKRCWDVKNLSQQEQDLVKKGCSKPEPLIEKLRSPSADEIKASVKDLLSVPREPVMNPCL